jgi:hypothetical protein
MTEFTLTLLDTSAIQRYIFDSNRLQENIGASELVYRITTLWVFDVLEKNHFRHNIKNPYSLMDWGYEKGFQIEKMNDDNAVEVVYAAGGNAVLVFRRHEKAVEFTKAITLDVLKKAPGLTLLVQHLRFDWENDSLSDKCDKDGKALQKGKRTLLNDQMEAHKLSRLPSLPTLGLSVSAVCESTGLPAVDTNEKYRLGNDESRLVSRETLEKLANRNYANDRLEMVVGDTKGYKSPYDIDMLGRISGEESYVAVIHADGNQVGKHVMDAMVNKADNRDYITASRGFSESMHTASINALREVIAQLIDAVIIDEKDGMRYVSGKVPLIKKSNIWYLPFRPLVFGGDDVTFLCNGQLGVELATRYLEAFEKHTDKQGLKGFYASAGVAVVKMHYPFARAYQLSEELTHSAKKFVKDKVKKDTSAVDWHFAQSGLSGSLDVIRNKEYSFIKENGKGETVKHHLNLRPLVLRNLIQSWQSVENIMSIFQDGKPWSESHNKVVGLREPLRNGAKAVEQYRLNYDLPPLPDVAGDKAAQSGWLGVHCIYFDAIELLDHHVSLKAEINNDSK